MIMHSAAGQQDVMGKHRRKVLWSLLERAEGGSQCHRWRISHHHAFHKAFSERHKVEVYFINKGPDCGPV
jgi:hypothetical protein